MHFTSDSNAQRHYVVACAGSRHVSGRTPNLLIVSTNHYTIILYACHLYDIVAENRVYNCIQDKKGDKGAKSHANYFWDILRMAAIKRRVLLSEPLVSCPF